MGQSKNPKHPGSVTKSKGNKKDDEVKLLARRKRVAQLYVEGKSQFEIAALVGISQPMVGTDLKRIRDSWLATAILDWDEVKAKELAKLDQIEERMWEAYHRSYGTEETVTVNVHKELRDVQRTMKGRSRPKPPPEDDRTDIVGPKGLPFGESQELKVVDETTNTRIRNLPGNPAFMTVILDCIKLRCKLLGFLDEKNTNINVGVQIDWDVIAATKSAEDPIEAKIKNVLTMGPESGVVETPPAIVSRTGEQESSVEG